MSCVVTLVEMVNLEIKCDLDCKSCYRSLENLSMGMQYIAKFSI